MSYDENTFTLSYEKDTQDFCVLKDQSELGEQHPSGPRADHLGRITDDLACHELLASVVCGGGYMHVTLDA